MRISEPAVQAKHTATPWKRDKYGHIVDANGRDINFRSLTCLAAGSEESIANAEANTDLIVRACNAHDDLVKALQSALSAHEGDWERGSSWDKKARAALAKATATE